MRSEFIRNFEIPDEAALFLDFFFTKEDIRLGAAAGKEQFSEELVKGLMGEKAEAYCRDAYRRGIISIADREKKLYRLNNFYGFLDIFCTSRKEDYQTHLTREERRKLDDWYFRKYCERLDPDTESRPTEDVILSLDEAIRKVREDNRQIYQTHCDCKCLSGDCGLPTYVCLTYRDGVNSNADRGICKPIDKETAIEVLKKAHRAGLMQTWNPGGFCNCCGDCCYLFRAQKVRGSKRIWPAQHYLVSWEQEKCISCGLCRKRCHFGVFKRDENGKIFADNKECVGCGVCVSACPKQALTLKELKGNETEEKV